VVSVVDQRYAIKREVARGAMGVVFEATHLHLGTSVALKTLTPAASESASGGPRLMREARALAMCKHPNVVRVHDAGVCAQHGPYLALEMLEGRSLESFVLARQRLDVATVLRIGEQLCAAVAHVHASGIVHRDIKPANVIVTRDERGQGDSVRLIDFGLARMLDEQSEEGPKLTTRGELLGTIEYMAPEQVLQTEVGTALSDVYALGVVLYEALAGCVPFSGGPMALATAHAIGAEAPPLVGLRPDVPLVLAEAIASALVRDPAHRTGSAYTLGRACAALVRDTSGSLDLLAPRRGVSNPDARRVFTRTPYAAPARVTTETGMVDGRTEDISEGGLLVVAAVDCAEGDTVTVRFPLPASGRMVDLVGVARWIKSQRTQRAIGIAFRAVDVETLEEIRAHAEATRSRPNVPAS
jgi:serine/threonine protein kinase